jgi:ankyrin repeat protein
MLAASAGHDETLKALIDKGATISLRNKTSHTALMLAVKKGNLSALKILLVNGADPKRRNSDGNDSITLARMAKQIKAANYIETFNKNKKILNIF